MAIITTTNNQIVRKSIGNVTYRKVGDKIIASRRITKNNSSTSPQQKCRNSFGLLTKIARDLKDIIDIGFDIGKYGCRKNGFVKENHDLLNYLRTAELLGEYMPSLYSLLNALESDRFLGQVCSSKGSMNSNSQFWWNQKMELEGFVEIPTSYRLNDKVTLAVCFLLTMDNISNSFVHLVSVLLTSENLPNLNNENRLLINRELMPEIDNLLGLYSEFEQDGIIVTAIVERRNERSTSYFKLVKSK